ncbi:MAG: sigma-70 family RNA polymerase sigma factor [Candidatus Colwellbacteria bacterium]|nr:sigma-70 family RNA polymerase sigma factor [Candidatus Colwellbacteria bacterium]
MDTKQRNKIDKQLSTAYQDYSKSLASYAFFKTSDRMTSDDLTQSTFIKTWRYLVKGGKIDLMKAFLYHVLNNLIVDEYRKHKTTSLDILLEKGFEPIADRYERLFNALDGKAALLLIQRLPKKYQKVMHMRYVQCLSLQEMSVLTGQSKNAIAVQAHRGLIKLKLLYKPV